MLKGMLGQPHGGWPPALQALVLKGEEPIHVRPGELLEPADLEAERRNAAERVGHRVGDEALMSWCLYPAVYAELEKHRAEYSDTAVLPTKHFFYGLEPGQETSIEIEPGKTLIVKLVMVGPLAKDGTREVFFELNGEGRSAIVKDEKAVQGEGARVKANRGDARHVGAPMPGKVVKLMVKVGDAVTAGQVLLVTEAMKMETTVKARSDGKVAELRCAEGGKVEKDDLLAVLA
jgi:pyruvate carboxylase